MRRNSGIRTATRLGEPRGGVTEPGGTTLEGPEILKRGFDAVAAALLLAVLSPILFATAVAIRLESRGSAFFRCPRIGLRGREFNMLKFRKMHEGAQGPALTAENDDRFTRMGRFLARTKLDEGPQLWNVLRGDMSLVGPRPEDPSFVRLQPDDFEPILRVKPGITGLSQLAFARETQILDAADPTEHYVQRVLPQKLRMDRFYVEQRSLLLDARILLWTAAAVVLRRPVAVHRETGRLNVRRRPNRQLRSLPLD